MQCATLVQMTPFYAPFPGCTLLVGTATIFLQTGQLAEDFEEDVHLCL